jgi:acyl transferase domain-containing protein/acyl carrier protein
MFMSQRNGHSNGSVLSAREIASGGPEPIAIVGIGCRFPGRANDPGAFWSLLDSGTDAISEVPAERWNLQTFYDPDTTKPGKTYSRWGGFVEGIDQFDPHFFGISPREAARMDPQQRMLLEVAWEGLEDGGLSLEQLSGTKTAVFVGISNFDYSVLVTSFRDRGGIDVYTNTGGSLSIAANRISYCFDFRGPSVAVDTACSSALVAVHLACESIWRDGCPLALAGGVNALLLPDWYVGFCRMGMLSPEGRCRAFDARASGFVRSEGAGMIVLKPLARALEDGDRIYAVIRGTAVNQDGRTPGMTVPSEDAQEALVRAACQAARMAPSQIQYIEAHGTGTLVGDPIEARALGRVLSDARPAEEPCLIGSVKTNIGHLEAGSGIAGLIKVALALHHRRIPGNLHFDQPNPEIDFERLRLRVPTASEPWPAASHPASAGVNSFGFGGTNAHVVLQEAPSHAYTPHENGKAESAKRRSYLVPLSARSPEALREAARSIEKFVASAPAGLSFRDFVASASLRRTHHDHRIAIIAESIRDLLDGLHEYEAGRAGPGIVSGRARMEQRPRIAFVCSGQGPQWWAMGRQLLREEPVFRNAIARCDSIIRSLGRWTLLDALTADESASRMDSTAIAQPCLFAIQVALAQLWESWGVRPDALIGHSVGEVAAAHLAGVFDLDDAVRIIYHRGRCMELAPERGRMLAAAVSEDDVRVLTEGYENTVALAAVNSPTSVTLSGEWASLEQIARLLEARGVFHRFLKVHYAFHSAQMDPIREELLASLDGICPQSAILPLISTVTGCRVEGPELGPEYWWHNVREAVRFATGVERLVELESDTVIELSPHPVLAASVTECFEHSGRKVTVLPSLRRHQDERFTMLRSLGELHVLGHSVHWRGLLPRAHRFVPLPLYPWQHERCWHEAEESRVSRLTPPTHPLLGVSQEEPQPAWEARLDLRLAPYLADHRVRNSTIFPATAYLELAFAVAREAFGTVGFELRDVKLVNPCFLLTNDALWMRSAFDIEAAELRVFTRASQGGRQWTPHMTATLQPGLADNEEAESALGAVRNRCKSEYSRDRCYDRLRTIGLDYGPAFQGIEAVWTGNREALGSVRLPRGVAADEGQYLFHPALFDACLQVVIPAESDLDDGDAGLYLPAEIDRVQLIRLPTEHVWVHARWLEKSARESTADVDIYNEWGQPCARIRGLRSRRVSGGRDEALDDMLYAYQWRAQPLSEAAATVASGRWLIFADDGGLGAALAERLQARGDICTLVFAHSARGSQPEDLEPLLGGLTSAATTSSRGIVHLWNLNAPQILGMTTHSLAAAQDAGLVSIVHLVQAWERASQDQSGRLILVTRGAQSVGDQAEALEIAQSPVIGLGRVITGEYPRLACKLVELDPHSEDGGLRSLFAEVTAADEEDEVAWRGAERYVHRYTPTPGVPDTARSQVGGPYRVVIRKPGTLDGLVAQSIRRRPPGPGEVEIEVFAAGLNFSDVMKTLGLYPGLADGPVPLGAECSGVVSAVGEGVRNLKTGDEVLAAAALAFGSHVIATAELVALKPPGISFEEAAALPIAFLTAAYSLQNLARLQSGESVLIHSASGGVGLAAVQLARGVGARVFATAGNDDKRDYLRSLGIEAVMDSRSLEFADEVKRRTRGRGYDVILNSLPGAAISAGLASLADYGRFVEIGKRDIYENSRLGLQPFRKNLSFFAVDLERVMRERPRLLGMLLEDVVRRVRDRELEPLPYRAWPIQDAVDAFRFMQQSKHIGKVVLSLHDQSIASVPSEDEPVTFRADATYLITGGLGGFGLAVARWMAGRGAGNLVLLGRRGAETREAQQAVEALKPLGARVIVRAADVSNAEDVADTLARIDRDLPPLRGIIHAAMVLEDSLLINLDRDRMERVLAPKVRGTWNLHQQTLGRPLDYFVLFSSLSSVFGHAGQGNYAAANAFLDAMAWHRRSLGLPALCVNWGYLGEVGYLARREELGERLERQGVLSFTVQQALILLEKAMQREHIQVSVMRLDWSRWRGLGVTGRVSPRFAHLCRPDAAQTDKLTDSSLPTVDDIRASVPGLRRKLLDALIRDKIARVLGTTLDRLDSDRPLLQLGVDSLMAVELRNWIEGELHVNLPISELMSSPSITGLATVVAERFARSDDDATTPVPSDTGTVRQEVNGHKPARPEFEVASEDLLDHLDALSGVEVDTLLASLLEARGQCARP